MARMTREELLAKRASMPKYDAVANAESVRETGRDLRGMRAVLGSEAAKMGGGKT